MLEGVRELRRHIFRVQLSQCSLHVLVKFVLVGWVRECIDKAYRPRSASPMLPSDGEVY